MILKGKIRKVFCTKMSWASILVDVNGEIIKFAGKIIEPQENMIIEAEGEMNIHPTFGEQFVVTSAKIEIPKTREDIIRYLKSDLIKGCGESKAVAIVDKFGLDTLDVIESGWEQLTQVKGISESIAKKIYESNKNAGVYKNLLSYADLTPRQAEKIYEMYKEKSLDILKENPYKIIFDIFGFGFKIVDKIALKNGFSKTAPERIAAVLNYVLTKIGDDGHCYCSIDMLDLLVKEQIPDIDTDLLAKTIKKEIEKGRIIIENNKNVYARKLNDVENGVAEKTHQLLTEQIETFSQTKIDEAILDTEMEYGFELEQQQKQAVQLALNHRLSIITGGPGTGKSTLVKAIIKAWSNEYGEDRIVLCAPTGKAAHRLAEVTNLESCTAHSFVITSKSNQFANDKKLLIVDESSMIDLYLADDILQQVVNKNFAVVFIGDVDQLPPIGPGSFFRDLVDSIYVPTVKLNLCHRQKGLIAVNSKKINEGSRFSLLSFDDTFEFIKAEKEQAREKVIDAYLNFTKQYDLKDICCIVPMRKAGKSQTAADDLNKILRQALNPYGKAIPNTNLFVGDRVMNTVNDTKLGLVNGDCGTIIDYDEVNDFIAVAFDDGRIVDIKKSIHSLTHSYAVTAHKSQGSEYKAIVIAHNREHFIMLQRNLLYTAVTRAKEKVALIGEAAAFAMAINNTKEKERRSKLKSKIALNCVNKKKI